MINFDALEQDPFLGAVYKNCLNGNYSFEDLDNCLKKEAYDLYIYSGRNISNNIDFEFREEYEAISEMMLLELEYFENEQLGYGFYNELEENNGVY